MKFLLLICSFLFLAGCATSITHVGAHWGHSQGPVSNSDAEKASKLVEIFHDSLKNKKWNEVYEALDKKIQSKISLAELQNSFGKLDASYGLEQSFTSAKNPVAEILASIASSYDEGKRADGFLYYDSVLSRHLSVRNKSNLIYVIGVTKSEKGGPLKINSLQICTETNGLDLTLKNPIFQVSNGHPQLIK